MLLSKRRYSIIDVFILERQHEISAALVFINVDSQGFVLEQSELRNSIAYESLTTRRT